ncbi:hypothetical protein [Bacillus velezensis]
MFGIQTLTYRQLNERSNQLARILQDKPALIRLLPFSRIAQHI